MTTVNITLPDALAQEASKAGLLAPERMERMIREGLRQERVDQLKAARVNLFSEPTVPMTPDEIAAEIAAYRAERRRATDRVG